ncbi:YheC/YheD family protein [Caldalkalibacillus mannanilyticus]|uniref:YheC/YheD family protein n=1 Tax=Caldalkalibacillus mannanilyticus TaxID=1418 RepID=UPI00046A54F0|nr:YheC/YheD family protein [Caldalkalibacillus mannanilyticus]
MLGIVFSAKKLKKIVNGKETQENMEFYYRLAEFYQVDLFMYDLQGLLRSTDKVKGYFYSSDQKSLELKEDRIPPINLFRAVFYKKKTHFRLKQIESRANCTFINLIGERNKWHIYSILRRKKYLLPFLPQTMEFSQAALERFLTTYSEVVIKPVNGAFGSRILVVKGRKRKKQVKYTERKKVRTVNMLDKDLYPFLLHRMGTTRSYLIQPYLSLQEYNGSKYDLRVSVQKGRAGRWEITGIVARVARENGIVTNVAQGGAAVSYFEVKGLIQPEIMEGIKELSLSIAREIEQDQPMAADLGVDLAIDKKDRIWLIEVNFCDERYAYRESGDLKMWCNSYRYPFEYALNLYQKSLEKGGADLDDQGEKSRGINPS